MKTISTIKIFVLAGLILLTGTLLESCLFEEEEEPTEEKQYLELLDLISSDETSESLLNEGYELEGTFIENQEAIYPAGETVFDAGAIWFKNSNSDFHFVIAVINNYSSKVEALAALNGEGNLDDDAEQSVGDIARQGTVDYKTNRIANALAFVRNSCYVFISSCSSDTLSPAIDFAPLYAMANNIDNALVDLGPLKYIADKTASDPENRRQTSSPGTEDIKSILKQRMYHLLLFKDSEEIGYADVRFKAYLNIDGECNSSCIIGGEDVYCHAVDLTGELVRFHLNLGASDGDPVAEDGDLLLRGDVEFTYECSEKKDIYKIFNIEEEIGDITGGETLASDDLNTAEPTKGMWPVVFVEYSGCQCPNIENIVLKSLSLYFHDNDSGGALDIISEAVEIFMEYNDRFKFVKFSNATSLKIHLIYSAIKLIGKYIVVPIWDDINFVGGVDHTFNADEEKVPWSL